MAEGFRHDHADPDRVRPPELSTLRTGLRDAYRGVGPVSDDRDRVIRTAIRDRFAVGQRRRPVVRRIGPWAAAAAAVVALAVWLAGPWRSPTTPPHPLASAAEPADVDRNGRVDILDAFALARRIDAGEARGTRLDLNRDGAVDASDVDLIASRAVALDEGAG